jgi:hypothetical protein
MLAAMKGLPLLLACLLTGLLGVLAPATAQNSTKKIRTKPSAIAAKAGSAVQWRATVDDALAESVESGKPVFWYVPTLDGSFMDRKVEIDRYMLAGPFSWPRAIALLNERFIPVRQAASKQLGERFGIERVEFIEPGYLVLDGEGEELMRQDRTSTFHPQRFLGPLAALVEVPLEDHPYPGDRLLDDAQYRDGRWQGLFEASVDDVLDGSGAEAAYLRGVLLFHAGRESDAAQVWQTLSRTHPEHPLAWKAAAEAEGHGPLVHGFEVYDRLPAEALAQGGEGTRAPAGVFDEAQLWERGLSYLRRMQRSDGCFRDSTYDFGGTDGLPNVFTAVTAIVAHAMLESQARLAEPDPRTEAALQLARAYLSDEACVNADDRDERVWAHIYRVRLFARWLELRPSDVGEVRSVLTRVSQALAEMQDKQGAWYHEYSNPFVTSNALIALWAAREQNIEVTGLDSTISAGTRALLKCRTAEAAYTYGYRAGGNARADVEGGVGRIPLGELALHLWGSETGGDLEKAVALSFEHEEYLLPVQKYDDHTRTFAYGGFFFWYDLHGRVEAIAALPPGPVRDAAVERQREQLLSLPEFDGCFVDSHEIGRCYGTAMALNCLAILSEL